MSINQDHNLIKRVKSIIIKFVSEQGTRPPYHPVDEEVVRNLDEILSKLRPEDDSMRIFNYTDDLKKFWKENIKKSIMCLRYYDEREPFKDETEKIPVAYGIDDLYDYFEKYTEFESMLYGSNKYYRDHVIHTFRTWLLGLEVLLQNDNKYLSEIHVGDKHVVNYFEKISIWAIISLTHDLGYPLEKSQNIINQTRQMMQSFVSNPTINMDITFNGVQNSINNFIIRFISSKMKEKNNKCTYLDIKTPVQTESDKNEDETVKDQNKADKSVYVARLQPKYYMKLSKSLEKTNHGIISTIIVYKLLQYFLESDYSIDEDYTFDQEDARQFYIRREILRSMASHTCKDIYHLDMRTFSYLLIIVDDIQDWGRKRFNELLTESAEEYELKSISNSFEASNFVTRVEESVKIRKPDLEQLKNTLKSLYKQNITYKEIFRDGQDTKNRNFSFIKECSIEYPETRPISIIVTFQILKNENAKFEVKIKKTGTNSLDEKFNKDWFDKIFETQAPLLEGQYSVFNILNMV